MKKYIYIIACGVLTILCAACGGTSSSGNSADGSSNSSSGLLADISGTVVKCAEEQAELEAKAKECKELEDLAKLGQQMEKLKAEAEAKLDALAKKLIGKKIPYQTSEGLFYTITSDPVLTKATSVGSKAVTIYFTFRAAQKEAMEIPRLGSMDYPICYKFVDSKGNLIKASLIYPILQESKPIKLAAGQDYGKDLEINFSIAKDAAKDADIAELVFISKAEYDSVKK